VGMHLINIKRDRRHVPGSPMEIMVGAGTPPDASKVKVYGKGLSKSEPGQHSEFMVDTKDAGYGALGLSVEGPCKVHLNCVDQGNGVCIVDYTADEPGDYQISVKYAGSHAPGSPFDCKIGSDKPVDAAKPKRRPIDDECAEPCLDDGLESEMSDMLAFPSKNKARSPQDFQIKFTGTGGLNASVTRPSGIEDEAEVVETGKDTYTVRFVPRETGEHLVNVKSRKRHIPGSPFKVLVETPAGGSRACKAHGPGLDGGVAGVECRFTVVTRDAGPGGLAVAVEGPAKAEIQCHDNGDGSCDISWFPVEEGEYTVHIRFADEAIPGSPFKVFVQPAAKGSVMSMDDFKNQTLKSGQQAGFAVNLKGKKGKVSATVESPSSSLIDCTAVKLDDDQNYAIRFIPRELGDHMVNVTIDGKDVPGSPFTIHVGGLEGDPRKVMAYGPGLKGGLAGTQCEFTVNALDAGSGALALSIDGPAKVKMNCVEQDEGTYKVMYTPTVSGTYDISVRFAGQHITYSPFKIRVCETEKELSQVCVDSTLCKVDGFKGAVNKGERNTFTLDTSKAGKGGIMLGMDGPCCPCKDLNFHYKSDGVYEVSYTIDEAGSYVLHVMWAGGHVPGSPFNVTL